MAIKEIDWASQKVYGNIVGFNSELQLAQFLELVTSTGISRSRFKPSDRNRWAICINKAGALNLDDVQKIRQVFELQPEISEGKRPFQHQVERLCSFLWEYTVKPQV